MSPDVAEIVNTGINHFGTALSVERLTDVERDTVVPVVAEMAVEEVLSSVPLSS